MAEKRKAGPSNTLRNWTTRRRFELPVDDALWTFDPNEPSPNDPTERKALKVEDLDLDQSYVGKIKPQARPRRPRKYRPWQGKGRRNGGVHAIDLPKRWHTREDDLEPDDIDGQIERAYERIEENIRPEIFRHRLGVYERAKYNRELLFREEPNAESFETARRLRVLRKMKVQMTGKGKDSYCQIPNIDALINAYETKSLSWNPGLVTYWSGGRKLCEPRPFDWDEFEAINKANAGFKSFWTEGLNGPDPVSMLYIEPIQLLPRTHPSSMTEIFITLRIPTLDWWIELPFVHDTGASTMTIYQHDLNGMLGPHLRPGSGVYVPLLGEQAMAGFDDHDKVTHYPCVELEATICNRHGERLTAWTRVSAVITGQVYDLNDSAPRVDGPITRSLLYMASAPDGTGRDYICPKQTPLARALPAIDLENNPPTVNSQYVGSNPYLRPAPPQPPPTPPAPVPDDGKIPFKVDRNALGHKGFYDVLAPENRPKNLPKNLGRGPNGGGA